MQVRGSGSTTYGTEYTNFSSSKFSLSIYKSENFSVN